MYYRDADGAVIVYDLGDIDSFKQTKKWIEELNIFLPQKIPLVIAGNKADLPNRVVTDAQAEELAKKYATKYFYTSAKTGENTEEMFKYLAQEIVAKKPKKETRKGMVLKLPQQTKKDKGCC